MTKLKKYPTVEKHLSQGDVYYAAFAEYISNLNDYDVERTCIFIIITIVQSILDHYFVIVLKFYIALHERIR
ncbi:hypothetical protein T06_4581 [Trichinella sp. T6]|nr:hypothetical protein T06_4581 [Trichinella sp. T6]